MATEEMFTSDVLKLDCAYESEKICNQVREIVFKQFRKHGVVVALSGGIDSSVVGALCVQALGKDRVFGLLMPEKDSSPETLHLSCLIAEYLGIRVEQRDITSILEAVGCYHFRDEAIKSVVDEETRARLTSKTYRQIVAATNFKQRVRKMLEYYHADRLNYAVAGSPNRLEYDQGFFVKLGDGAADFKPIAHLYKTQVYQMAEFLTIPEKIRNRGPTTDTYSMPQSQEEFYFSVPYDKMDICLYGKNHNVPPAQVAQATGLTTEQVQRVYRDIDDKRNATRYLHMPALLIQKVEEISHQ